MIADVRRCVVGLLSCEQYVLVGGFCAFINVTRVLVDFVHRLLLVCFKARTYWCRSGNFLLSFWPFLQILWQLEELEVGQGLLPAMVGNPLTKDVMLTSALVSQLFSDIYFLRQGLQSLEGVTWLFGGHKLLQLSYLLFFGLAKLSFIFFTVILLHFRTRHVSCIYVLIFLVLLLV